MRKTTLALMALTMLGAFVLPVFAQEEEVRLDLDFRGETLDQVLQLFRRGYGLEYTLGEGVDPNTSITTHLRGVTLDQALRSILEPNGLLAVEQNGRYTVRVRPAPTERDAEARVVAPVFTTQTRTPPAPTRQAAAYEPRRGAAQDENATQERDEIMEIIYPMYLGADMASSIFGGGFVEAGGYYGGGSGYGGGSSGYGGSSYGSGGYGSNRGSSFGSNRNSGFGGSSSSNFGSNRSSSRGTNRNIGY
ncbi:MAG TPA: hypothetical protein DEP45_12710 [Armatimonadetes bacterium]|nr:hypothetical protein [Armatimonadota bacterium]